MVAVWIAILLAAILGTSLASRRAVASALRVTDALKVSPALVGLTVMSIGTDLPEIANSLISTSSGHGDLNVGDSMGSVVTQITLTLAILCLAGGSITTNRNFVLGVGTATFFAAVVVRILVDDGDLSRIDGAILIMLWIGGTTLLGHGELKPRQIFTPGNGGVFADLISALAWLSVVGIMAVVIVESFVQLAETFGIPEFVGSFIVLAIGTSLPELFVDWTAIRQGASSMAVGDVFGSSFVDATLSIGIGPAIFSSMVSSSVLVGTTLAAGGVLMATLLVARSDDYNWRLAIPLLMVYATVQVGSFLGA